MIFSWFILLLYRIGFRLSRIVWRSLFRIPFLPHFVKAICIVFHLSSLLSFGKVCCALRAAMLLRFYYTEETLGFLLPVLTPRMGDVRGILWAFLNKSIDWFSFFSGSHIQTICSLGNMVFEHICRYIQIFCRPWLVHSQTVSIAMVDLVVIRLPVILSPVIVLCTLRHPEEKQWGEWIIRLKNFQPG